VKVDGRSLGTQSELEEFKEFTGKNILKLVSTEKDLRDRIDENKRVIEDLM
jgi:hypothetical protein